jgi:hypothetical protein
MKPTIGRIVVYTLDSGAERPAMITHVDVDTVNLAVMTDIDDRLPCPLLLRGMRQGTGKRTWRWPVVEKRVSARASSSPADNAAADTAVAES